MRNERQNSKQRVKPAIITAIIIFLISTPVTADDNILNRLFFDDFNKISSAVSHDWAKTALIAGGLAAAFIPVYLNDAALADTIKYEFNNDFNDIVFKYANYGGDLLYILAADSFLFLGGEKEKKTAEKVIESVLLAGGINYIIKILAGRHRPSSTFDPYMYQPLTTNTSMPSGHACVVFAWATVIGDSYDIGYITYPAAFLCGLARIYNNAHWPSDVIIGGFIGTFIAKAIMAESPGENIELGLDLKYNTLKTVINIRI